MQWEPTHAIALAALFLLLAYGLGLLSSRRGRRPGPIGGGELQELERRMDTLTLQVAGLPNPERMIAAERVIAVAQSELAGIKTAVARVERMVEMLLEHQIEGKPR